MVVGNSGNKIMSNVVQTKFVGKNPFKAPREVKQVDVSTLRVTNDKPKKRIVQNCKYDAIFKDLDIGKSLSCKSEDCDKVAQAVRAYMRRYNKPWKIKATIYYTKTTARIFVLPKE